jgi:hypothetical protein
MGFVRDRATNRGCGSRSLVSILTVMDPIRRGRVSSDAQTTGSYALSSVPPLSLGPSRTSPQASCTSILPVLSADCFQPTAWALRARRSIVKNQKHFENKSYVQSQTPISCYATASNLAPTFKTPVKLPSKIGTQRTSRGSLRAGQT